MSDAQSAHGSAHGAAGRLAILKARLASPLAPAALRALLFIYLPVSQGSSVEHQRLNTLPLSVPHCPCGRLYSVSPTKRLKLAGGSAATKRLKMARSARRKCKPTQLAALTV